MRDIGGRNEEGTKDNENMGELMKKGGVKWGIERGKEMRGHWTRFFSSDKAVKVTQRSSGCNQSRASLTNITS